MAELSRATVRVRTRRALASLARWPVWIGLAIAGWRERSLLRRELDGLHQQGELDRTLQDSGITASDVPRLLHAHPRTAQQLSEMIGRLGINRRALARSPAIAEALRVMEWRCGECANWRKCRIWLDTGDVGESYRAFCPNAAALDELRTSGIPAGKPCGILAELAAARGSDRIGG